MYGMPSVGHWGQRRAQQRPGYRRQVRVVYDVIGDNQLVTTPSQSPNCVIENMYVVMMFEVLNVGELIYVIALRKALKKLFSFDQDANFANILKFLT